MKDLLSNLRNPSQELSPIDGGNSLLGMDRNLPTATKHANWFSVGEHFPSSEAIFFVGITQMKDETTHM